MKQPSRAFDANGVPVLILADENGKVVHYWTGFDNPAEMDAVLARALKTHAASVASSSSAN